MSALPVSVCRRCVHLHSTLHTDLQRMATDLQRTSLVLTIEACLDNKAPGSQLTALSMYDRLFKSLANCTVPATISSPCTHTARCA